jgi:SNF2 family DNA or RNA helicase
MGTAEEDVYKRSLLSGNHMLVRQVSWNVADIANSSKANRLLEICEEAGEDGRKLLVFSFFLDTIAKVQGLLGEKCFGPITGSVAASRRQEMVDAFSAAAPGSVLLCQIIAGGVGLNIQSASVVVICEPQWKPSTENQAISRAYRMGQSKEVMVHRLLADETVDERILEILKGKAGIFDAFADESATDAAAKGISESKAMSAIIQGELEKYGLAGEAQSAAAGEAQAAETVPAAEPDEAAEPAQAAAGGAAAASVEAGGATAASAEAGGAAAEADGASSAPAAQS